jgi:hypothetical protein
LELQIDLGLHFIDDDRQRAEAGHDAGFAGDYGRPALPIWPDEGDGRPILPAREVFANGKPHKVPQVVFEGFVPGELVEVGQSR